MVGKVDTKRSIRKKLKLKTGKTVLTIEVDMSLVTSIKGRNKFIQELVRECGGSKQELEGKLIRALLSSGTEVDGENGGDVLEARDRRFLKHVDGLREG